MQPTTGHSTRDSRSWVSASRGTSEFLRLRNVVDALVRTAEHSGSTTSLLDDALNTVMELTRATGAVVLLSEAGKGLSVASVKGQMTHVERSAFDDGQTLARACLESHSVLHSDATHDDARIHGPACARAKMRSLIATPLRYGDDVLGVLEVCSSVTHAFDTIDAQAVALLGNAMGGALGRQMALDDNARLLARLEEALHVTQATARRYKDAALYDALTGLPNRAMLENQLEEACRTHQGHANRFALMFIDLDAFKPINDTHGHATGDAVLREVGRVLQECVRDNDLVARLGGDEFVILLSPLRDAQHDAQLIAAAIKRSLEQPREIDGITFTIRASAGWVVFDNHDAQSMLAAADQAMYRNKKERGRR
jgi:diguanylate cyclase (GGDEF)-like protein